MPIGLSRQDLFNPNACISFTYPLSNLSTFPKMNDIHINPPYHIHQMVFFIGTLGPRLNALTRNPTKDNVCTILGLQGHCLHWGMYIRRRYNKRILLNNHC